MFIWNSNENSVTFDKQSQINFLTTKYGKSLKGNDVLMHPEPLWRILIMVHFISWSPVGTRNGDACMHEFIEIDTLFIQN